MPAPFANPTNYRYTLADLFAGIGGIRLGFTQTGAVKTVYACESNRFACLTYYTNFGDDPMGNIHEVEAADVPDHDILTAGFPCQAFSQAGRKLGFEDRRGALFFDVVRILKAKHPRAFLLENVKALRGHNHGKTFNIVLSTLQELGYTVHSAVLAARDFGVPQIRERLFIVGFDNSQVANADTFAFPEPTYAPTSLTNVLEPNVSDKYTVSNKMWAWHKDRKAKNLQEGKGYGYSLFSSNAPYVNTISARYYKDGNEALIEQEGRNPRKLTPREVARVQGFPDSFSIPVSDCQAYQQFGNSVAVPVVHAIATKMIEFLDTNSIPAEIRN